MDNYVNISNRTHQELTSNASACTSGIFTLINSVPCYIIIEHYK